MELIEQTTTSEAWNGLPSIKTYFPNCQLCLQLSTLKTSAINHSFDRFGMFYVLFDNFNVVLKYLPILPFLYQLVGRCYTWQPFQLIQYPDITQPSRSCYYFGPTSILDRFLIDFWSIGSLPKCSTSCSRPGVAQRVLACYCRSCFYLTKELKARYCFCQSLTIFWKNKKRSF